jgi:sirohydrochlorin ferrochelatase
VNQTNQSGTAAKREAILLVDHGSKVAESNDLLERVAQGLRRQSPWKIVEPAHMELAEPSVATALDRCVAQGAERVIVFPYFLGPGRHVGEDIPRLVAEAAASHAGVETRVAQPFGLHDLLLEVVCERIAEKLDQK